VSVNLPLHIIRQICAVAGGDSEQVLEALQTPDGCAQLCADLIQLEGLDDADARIPRAGRAWLRDVATHYSNVNYQQALNNPADPYKALRVADNWKTLARSDDPELQAMAKEETAAIERRFGKPDQLDKELAYTPVEEHAQVIHRHLQAAQASGLRPDQYRQALAQQAEVGLSPDFHITPESEAESKAVLEGANIARKPGRGSPRRRTGSRPVAASASTTPPASSSAS